MSEIRVAISEGRKRGMGAALPKKVSSGAGRRVFYSDVSSGLGVNVTLAGMPNDVLKLL